MGISWVCNFFFDTNLSKGRTGLRQTRFPSNALSPKQRPSMLGEWKEIRFIGHSRRDTGIQNISEIGQKSFHCPRRSRVSESANKYAIERASELASELTRERAKLCGWSNERCDRASGQAIGFPVEKVPSLWRRGMKFCETRILYPW